MGAARAEAFKVVEQLDGARASKPARAVRA
jgi:hypothetical protein